MTALGTEKQKKSCFVIAPIGPTGSDTRKRSDKVLKHIFRSALEGKYTVTRADEIDEAGMITSQILRAVQDAHLVVADLTETNPNVLYELAVRHAIEKPIIHVIEPRLSKIPFDIAGFRTIEFDITDPDSIETAVDKLRKYAEQAESGKWGETPIKLANIMRTSKDDSPEMLLLKQAVEGISMVSARLVNIENSTSAGFSGSRFLALGGGGGNLLSQQPANAAYVRAVAAPGAYPLIAYDLTDHLATAKTVETKAPKEEGKEPSQPKGTPKK